jgi:hypothetical protein
LHGAGQRPVTILFHLAPVDAEFAAEGAAGDTEEVGGPLVVAFGFGEGGKDGFLFEAFEAEATLDGRGTGRRPRTRSGRFSTPIAYWWAETTALTTALRSSRMLPGQL